MVSLYYIYIEEQISDTVCKRIGNVPFDSSLFFSEPDQRDEIIVLDWLWSSMYNYTFCERGGTETGQIFVA